jgi:hypothetical protein
MTFLAARGLALDLSSLTSNVGGAALDTAAQAATSLPAVTVNRERLAAAVNLGYSVVDGYDRAKPGIFVASLVSTILSSGALAKRRKNPEAVALYSIIAISSALTAWFTRPDFLKGQAAVPPQSNAQAPGPVKSALGWADARAAKLSASQPGWEGRTLTRLWSDLGSGTITPAAQTLLTRNSH